jgi:hypothetical protein
MKKFFVLCSLVSLSLLPTFADGVTIPTHEHESNKPEAKKQLEQQTEQLTRTLTAPQAPKVRLPIPGSAAQGASVDKAAIARERSRAMQELATVDAAEFLSNVVPPNVRDTLSADVRANVEELKTVSGTMEILHADDFSDPKKSRFYYGLKSGGKNYDVYFAQTPPAMQSGASATIQGYLLGDTLVATGGFDTVIRNPAPPVPESVGVQSTLFILITTANNPPPLSKDQLKNTILNGNFQKFYKEQSYQLTSFTGDVTDWITVPLVTCGSPNLGWEPSVDNYLIKNGYDLSKYSRVMFISNGMGGGCASVGKFDVQFNGKTYRLSVGWTGLSGYNSEYRGMSNFEYVLSHEMGHELGVMHANSWGCSGMTLDKDCYHQEYGNSWDVMGTGLYSKHFNAFYKDLLGWLPGGAKQAVTASSILKYPLFLNPLESTTGVRALVISNPYITKINPSAQPIYVEYRQPIGYDRFLETTYQGLYLNQVVSFTDQFPFPRLIFANYQSKLPNSSPVMRPGSTFSWPSRGYKIQFLFESSPGRTFAGYNPTKIASVMVAISPAACQSNGLTIEPTYEQLTVAPGSSAIIQLNMNNMDTVACRPALVSMTAAVGEGWSTYTYPSGAFSLSSGQQQWASINIMPPLGTPNGQYPLRITVTDATTNRTFALDRTISVVAPPTLATLSPSKGPAGTKVLLSGSGFSVSPQTNTVSMTLLQNGQTYYAFVPAFTYDSTKLGFVVPTTMQDSKGNPVPTPAGPYSVAAINAGNAGSNMLTFEVTPAPFGFLPYEGENLQLAAVVHAFWQFLLRLYSF